MKKFTGISAFMILLIGVLLSSALSAQIQAYQVTTGNPNISYLENQDIPGNNLKNFELKPDETCQTCIERCLADPDCKGYTYVKPGVQGPNARCYLKSAAPNTTSNNNCISGIKLSVINQTGYFIEAGIPAMKHTMGQNRPGNDYRNFEVKHGDDCQTCEDSCLKDPRCKAYTYVLPGIQAQRGVCWLKSEVPVPIDDKNCISGVKYYEKEKSPFEIIAGLSPDFTTWSPYDGPAIRAGIDLPGNDFKSFLIPGGQEQLPFTCQRACLDDSACLSWTFVEPGKQGKNAACWLKNKLPSTVYRQDSCISGIRLASAIVDYNPRKILTAGDIENFKTELDRFDTQWKNAMATAVGDLNKRTFQFKKDKIIIQKQLLIKHANQIKTPGPLKVPIANPWYSLEIKGGITNVMLQGKQIFNLNINDYSRPAALPQPMPYPGFLFDFKEGSVDASIDGKTIRTVKTDIKPQGELPIITAIHSITTDETFQKDLRFHKNEAQAGISPILDGHYIIIYGKNLGTATSNCGVRIEYDQLNQIEFSNEPDKKVAFDLIPYRESWESSWFDDMIIALIPPFPLDNQNTTNSSILIWRDGPESFLIKREIKIEFSESNISFIQYTPTDTPLYDDAKFYIYGKGFNPTGEGKEIKIISNAGEFPVTKIESWSENVIIAYAPEFNLDTVYDATLVIINKKEENRDIDLPIQIGPLMIFVWVTGERFAVLQDPDAWDEGHIVAYKEIETFQNVFSVSHYPGCDRGAHSGNNTSDWYFKNVNGETNKEMPRYFRLNNFFFLPLDPRMSKSVGDYLLEIAKDIIWACSDPVSFVIAKGIEALCHLFDPGMGLYALYINKPPIPFSPSTEIHFNNACTDDYAGLPNKYLIAFQLYGPAKYAHQLEYNEEDMLIKVEELHKSIKDQ
ncbi:MAG: PAN domain-containing protein [Bacteroidales bacterium]|nr:PAN domain-containing protein [Bacteroidales bacterium]